MASQIMVNLTSGGPRSLAVVPIVIDYGADFEKARVILTGIAQNHPLVQEVAGCPMTQLQNASVTLSVRAWCANPADAKQVEFDLYEQAKKQFDEKGIEVPNLYTTVVLKKQD